MSLLEAIIAVAYLLATTRRAHPGIDVGIELSIVLVNIIPISFCASASGPLQWWQTRTNLTVEDANAGKWELVGLTALVALE